MSKTTIALIVAGLVALAASFIAVYSSGRNAGREETQLDSIDRRLLAVESKDTAFENRITDLEHWRNRWGKGAGAEAPK